MEDNAPAPADETRQSPEGARPPDEDSSSKLEQALEPPRRALVGRLRSTFGVAYLTLTGVTQSVAMAVLAARVEATYEQFDAVHWILTVNTFLIILLVWNDYMIASIAYFWIPSLADAFFPFSLLALQLFLAHNVYPDVGLWFLAAGALLAVGTGAFAYGFWQSRRHPLDNADVLRAIGVHQALTMVYTAAGSVLALLVAVLYHVAGLERVSVVVALLGSAVIIATLLRSVPYWNRITAYSGVRSSFDSP